MKTVIPSISETAFNCPHCGVLAHQHWFIVQADGITNGSLPALVEDADLERLRKSEDANKAKILARLERMKSRRPLIYALNYRSDFKVENVWLTKCFNCQEVAVWVGGVMTYPEPVTVSSANPDTPPEIMRDYDEARLIVQKSPRGAAALLRLAIQKLCKHLGEPGKNINEDICPLAVAIPGARLAILASSPMGLV
ncbi:hypothetical protein ACCT25_30075, partial [Rhizobium ruizarguesonis]